MQHSLQLLAGDRISMPPPGQGPACTALRHRSLMLIGPRGPARLAGSLGRRVLDRLLAPSAQVEGVDLHLADTTLGERAALASGFVLVLPPVGNLTNPFFRVHPRRNDRFVAARPPLKALFPEVDFTAFAFTGHVLGTLAAVCPERFSLVRQELEAAWRLRMRLLLLHLPSKGVLIDLPAPEWLPRPALTGLGLRHLSLDPDDRAAGAEALRAALRTAPS